MTIQPASARSTPVRTSARPAGSPGLRARLAGCLALLGLLAGSTAPGASLDAYIKAQMQAGHLPGLQAVIVKDGRVVWEGAYGMADLATGRPVTAETLFLLASVSKTVTATAVVQQAELGHLDLDANVSALLPFPVVHPNAPTVPITARHLLTHTAGIEDNWAVMPYTDGDCTLPLMSFTEAYFSPGGRLQDVNANWHPTAPGTAFSYSNAGFALAGSLVEQASGQDFAATCQQRIFEPLGMRATSFRLADLDTRHIAHPYSWTGSQLVDMGFYGFPDYPDGSLRTSARQLARFAVAHMDGGGPLLSPAWAAAMQSVQAPLVEPSQALGFYYDYDPGRPAPLRLGHNGGDAGAQADLWMRPWDHRTAVIVLANGDGGAKQQRELIDRLFVEARAY